MVHVATNKPFPTTPVTSGLPVVGMPPDSYNVATQQEQMDRTLLHDRFSIRSHELMVTNPSSTVMEDRSLLQATNKKNSNVGGKHIDALRKAKKSTDDALKAQRLNQQINATKLAEKNAREVTPYHTPYASATSQQNVSPGFSNLKNAVASPPALNKKIYNNGLNTDYFREHAQPQSQPQPFFSVRQNVSPVPGIPPPSQIYRNADLKAGCMQVMRKGYAFDDDNGQSVKYDTSYRKPASKLLKILCGDVRDVNDQCQYSLVWEIVEESRRHGSNVKETVLTLLTLFM